jgi:hypothetical protein
MTLACSLGCALLLGTAQAADLLATSFANSSAQTLTTPAFKPLPTDQQKPLLVTTHGALDVADGKLVLANSRFTLGAVSEGGKVEASTAGERPAGKLDLSRPYEIVIRVASAEALTPGKDGFFVYVNNSTTRRGDSPLGNASLVTRLSAAELKPGEHVIEGKAADANSFLQLRAESGAEVKISSLRIRYK